MKHSFPKRLTALVLMVMMLLTMIPAFAIGASAASETYTKVTEAPEDWSGTYLIVYEGDNVAFDSSLTKFDAVGNTQAVTIANNQITANSAYAFTIAAEGEGYSIKGTSGKYIGNASNSNALTTSDSALVNTISLNDDDSVNIIGAGGAYLRYNAASNQTRFRYYKSSSYTGQKAIALYKLTENTGEGGDETPCEHIDVVVDGLCDNCGECMGHKEVATITDNATCTVDGLKTITCEYCEEQIRTETISKLYHQYGTDGTCGRTDCTAVTPMPIGETVFITGVDKDEAKVELTGISDTSSKYGTKEIYTLSPSKYPLTVEKSDIPAGSDGTAIYLKTTNEQYLGFYGSDNRLYLLDKSDIPSENLRISWIPHFEEDGTFKLIPANDPERELRYNQNDTRFACYKSGQTDITVVIAPAKVVNFALTLNKGVTINVNYSIKENWLSENEGAKLIFKIGETAGEAIAPVAGEKVYSVNLTPAQLNSTVLFELQLADGTVVASSDVSVSKYAEKVEAATAAQLGLTDEKKDALVTLLDSIGIYASAADQTLAEAPDSPFEGKEGNAAPEGEGLFTAVAGSLGEQASLKFTVDTAKVDAAYTIQVTVGDNALVSNGAIADYITKDNQIVITNLYPSNFNDVITVTVSNSEGVVATVSATFNGYLKDLYDASTDADVALRNLLIATYNYGAAAEAYAAA